MRSRTHTGPNSNLGMMRNATQIMTFLCRLQHPEFVLDQMEENWLMYPPHVNATVNLTGRELSYALNLPKKSVSGLPVLETVPFGREVQRFTQTRQTRPDGSVYIGESFESDESFEHYTIVKPEMVIYEE